METSDEMRMLTLTTLSYQSYQICLAAAVNVVETRSTVEPQSQGLMMQSVEWIWVWLRRWIPSAALAVTLTLGLDLDLGGGRRSASRAR